GRAGPRCRPPLRIIYILRRQGFAHGAAERRRRIGDGYAGAPHRLDLVAGLALAARDDGAGMAHAPPRRSRDAGDEADDRLLRPAALQEVRRLLLGRAADLADHDDAEGLGIGEEELEAVDEVGAVDRIAADADAGRLTEAGGGRLRHRLVGERARAR